MMPDPGEPRKVTCLVLFLAILTPEADGLNGEGAGADEFAGGVGWGRGGGVVVGGDGHAKAAALDFADVDRESWAGCAE